MAMLPMATREEPVRWNSVLRDTLDDIGFSLTAETLASLNALTSYASSPQTLYSDPVTGAREAKAYCGLLLALDAAISSWPAELLENVVLPPVRVGDQMVPVSCPAMEAFVVLYNAAVSNCEEGNAAMARVHADHVRARTFHGMDAGSTTGVVASSSPNVNSKAAYKSFGVAVELAICAEHALMGESDRFLSPSDRHTLQRHLDFRATREFAELCMAIAKYTYSTTSGAVAKKHDTLAKLSYRASTMTVPAGLASSELLHLLPTLLLAAYHRHKAEHYKLAAKVPDMSLVLGHIAHSRRLVDDLQQHHMEAIASLVGRGGQQSSGWHLFGRLSATLMGASASNNSDMSEEPFGKFSSLLEETDLVKVFPLVGNLLHDIPKLHDRYQHDNAVVYYARPARLEDVIADTPEADLLGTASRESTMSPAVKLEVDATKFSDLPHVEMVHSAVQKRQEVHGLQDDVELHVKAVRRLILQLKDVLQLPPSVNEVLTQLEPLLYRNRDSTAVSLDVCIEEAYKAVSAALQRHECISDELYRAKSEYIGEYVSSFESTASLKQRGRAWRERADVVCTTVAKDLPRRGEAPTLRESLLLPEGPMVYACLTLGETAVAKANRALSAMKSSAAVTKRAVTISPSRLSTVLADLQNVQEVGAATLVRAQSLCSPSRWDRVCQTLSHARSLLVEAEKFVEDVEEETKILVREKSRIVLTPLTRLHDVCFDGDRPVERKQQRRVATPSPKTKATRRRLEDRPRSRDASEDELDDHRGREVQERGGHQRLTGDRRGPHEPQVTAGLNAPPLAAGRWQKVEQLSDSEGEPDVPKATIAPSLLRRIKTRREEAVMEKKGEEEDLLQQQRQRQRRRRR